MDLKAHAQYSLARTRWMTEQILESFTTVEDWVWQPHPEANHALWIIGHLGLADNAFVSRFRADKGTKPDGWDDLFWFGSRIRSDASDYPAPDEVLAYFRERRETLLAVLGELTDDELNADAPPEDAMDPIAGAPNIGHLFLFVARHEGIHTGQLTVAHRGLGNPPLFAPRS